MVQNIFLQEYYKVKFFSGTTEIYLWKSDAMSAKSIENIATSDNSFAPTFIDTRCKI